MVEIPLLFLSFSLFISFSFEKVIEKTFLFKNILEIIKKYKYKEYKKVEYFPQCKYKAYKSISKICIFFHFSTL